MMLWVAADWTLWVTADWALLVILYFAALVAGWLLGWGLCARRYSRKLSQVNRAIDTLIRPFAGLELSDDERRYLALQARYAARRARDWHHTPERADRWDMIATSLDPDPAYEGSNDQDRK